jgi:hypothetical protein
MPRYFFDIRDGADFFPDEEGQELLDLHEAKEEAASTLAAMARDSLRRGTHEKLTIEVRDEAGSVFASTVSFDTTKETDD